MLKIIDEGRKLYKINVMYDSFSNCFCLNYNGDNKIVYAEPDNFRKFLRKIKAKDSLTKPVSLRQVTYKQMVDAIIDGSDNKIIVWSNIWNKIDYRTVIKSEEK
jgi:hypothetical protein